MMGLSPACRSQMRTHLRPVEDALDLFPMCGRADAVVQRDVLVLVHPHLEGKHGPGQAPRGRDRHLRHTEKHRMGGGMKEGRGSVPRQGTERT